MTIKHFLSTIPLKPSHAAPFLTSLPLCPICNAPVGLEAAKTDEQGTAIHEECYVLELQLRRAREEHD